MKIIILTIIFLFQGVLYGQLTDVRDLRRCDDIGKKILHDSTLTLWNYPNLSLDDAYCLGRYFANWDLEYGRIIIQTYGDLSRIEPCRYCSLQQLGIDFSFHYDIMTAEVSEFIKGYNNVSEEYIRKAFGEAVLAENYKLDSTLISPNIFSKYWQRPNSKLDFFTFKTDSDTTMNVKINLDSLGEVYDINLQPLTFTIIDYSNRSDTIMVDYQSFKTAGIQLKLSASNLYRFKIRFNLETLEEVCFCKGLEWLFEWTVPVRIKYSED